jgi:hypothetical protein
VTNREPRTKAADTVTPNPINDRLHSTKRALKPRSKSNTTADDSQLHNRWLSSEIEKNAVEKNLMKSEIDKNILEKELIELLKIKTRLEIHKLETESVVSDSEI